jgi:hypothetical protein
MDDEERIDIFFLALIGVAVIIGLLLLAGVVGG